MAVYQLHALRPATSRRPSGDHVMPDRNAGLFGWLLFAWVTPLIRLGHQRPLEPDDIWPVGKDRSARVLSRRLNNEFSALRPSRHQHALATSLLRVFRAELLAAAAFQLISTVISVLTPFAIRYLISFANAAYDARNGPAVESPPLSKGFAILLAIVCMQLLQSFCTNHALQYAMLVGAQSRAALTTLILQKSMKLSLRARAGTSPARSIHSAEPWSNGRITNLMSVDTSRIDQACAVLNPVLTSPLAIALSLALLFLNISYGAFLGFLVLAIATPMIGRAMKLAVARRYKINKLTDSRISLAQELLEGIKLIKIFGWETTFLQQHHGLRKQEVRTLRNLIDLRNSVMSASMAIPVFAAAPSFAIYAYLSPGVAPARIFSSIGLLNSLRQPLSVMPSGISQLLDAHLAISRIQSFLFEEETEEALFVDQTMNNAITLADASFTWERMLRIPAHEQQNATDDAPVLRAPFERSTSLESQKFTRPLLRSNSALDATNHIFELKDISLTIGRAELVAVVGDVGSGKSSLLAALAGQMRQTSGKTTFGGARAVCTESGFIHNATIRDNITFGQSYEAKWYGQVVNACALTPDLDSFAQGDQTEVGERGATLSGGQKQRINIARAVYSRADIVLMDDPFSAVDAHVGEHILTRAVLDLLSGKCRVIATHQQQILPRFDKVIHLRNGRVISIEAPAKSAAKQRQPSFGLRPRFKQRSSQTLPVSVENVSSRPLPLMQAEERPTRGGVPFQVYASYISSSGTSTSVIIVLGLLVLLQSSIIGASLWLSCWTTHTFDLPDKYYLGVYATLGIVQAGLMFLFCKSISFFATQASYHMVEQALTAVVRSPMSFFDTTPVGRLVNRFSKDTDAVDNTLADSIRLLLMTFGSTIAVLTLIVSYYRIFILAILPVLGIYGSYTLYYRSSAREIKYHESTLRSKVFARFSETVNGQATIHAYGKQDRFLERTCQAVDDMNSAAILSFSYQRWLAVRLDCVGLVLVATAGLLAVRSSMEVDPSVIGIVIAWVISVAQMLQFTVRYLTDVDRDMVSVERLQHYAARLPNEQPPGKRYMEVAASWPARGEIRFDNADLRYRPGLPAALRNFTLHIKPGERFGIVGRTGAGKSSILTALLRLVNLDQGSIFVDGLDISQISLSDLRSRVTVVTQDPKLFRGTVRSNLDLLNQHEDSELSVALQRTHIGTSKEHHNAISLTSTVEEDGKNLSFGQRQLLVLARALVRRAQITVFDEATTAIDLEADERIQRTITEAFTGRTLICIAHRLKTVIGCDRICVMEAGEIAELGSPKQLWQSGGMFRRLAEQGGITEQDVL